MRVLFIQHDHVSPAGPIGERFESRGYSIEYLQVVPAASFGSPNVPISLPPASDFDVIVPMGSPWGVWEDDRIGNWLLPELAWLKTAHEAGIPILGICFGGQLMARTLGGGVSPAPSGEVGWTTILSDDPSLIPPGPWFQWHFDRWTLPPGATEIARSTRASQAFVQGRTLALQFHPEIVEESLRAWLLDGGMDQLLADGQDPEILMALTAKESPAASERAFALVDVFLDRVAIADPVL
ncbi:MAG TPA: type 1 glutamine amidotransferase [Candidatus Nanopelagicaceae bacterium]|nr:type 1 glutamine amidotransferase [Candidatus Nanopelagicaceae bacterium]